MMRQISRVAFANVNKKLFNKRCITSTSKEWATKMNASLSETDPKLYSIIEDEKVRQRDSLILIASENLTSKSVFDALG